MLTQIESKYYTTRTHYLYHIPALGLKSLQSFYGYSQPFSPSVFSFSQFACISLLESFYEDYNYGQDVTEKLESITPTVDVKTYSSLGNFK